MIQEIEVRWSELLKKPNKTKEEIEEKENLRNLLTQYLKDEIKELSSELKRVGAKFNDPWEMVNSKESYPEAIDILINHLNKPYHDRNKEGIVRALTVKEAKGKANQTLLEQYDSIEKEKHGLRWAIGNAFTVIITKNDVSKVSQIVKDRSNGTSRHRFVEALKKIKTEEVKACLTSLLDDEEMKHYAMKALEKFK